MHLLVLLRHAAAAPAAAGQPDVARELTDRGRGEAAAAGRWLAEAGLRPDLVLVSAAVRTQQTWAAVQEQLEEFEPRRVAVEEGLYAASAHELVDRLATLPEEVATVLVVGHEPVVSQAAAALAGPGSDGDALARVRAGVRTGSAVVLTQLRPWADLALGSATLDALHAPGS